MFSATEQNTYMQGQFAKLQSATFLKIGTLKNLPSGDFLISKPLAGILLKSNLRTERSSV